MAKTQSQPVITVISPNLAVYFHDRKLNLLSVDFSTNALVFVTRSDLDLAVGVIDDLSTGRGPIRNFEVD